MLVIKFGGLTLDNEEKRNKALKIIDKYLNEYKKLIIVTSAFGRRGDPYSTDTLLEMSNNMSDEYKRYFIGLGEIISSTYFANYLLSNNYNVGLLDYNYLDIDKFKLNCDFTSLLKIYDIVIVPGFVGTKNNKLTTLERGGSNISATFISYELKTNLVIISNIDGIYDENPVKLDAKKYLVINNQVLNELFSSNDTFMPKKALEYINSKTFIILFRDIESEYGTYILNI